MHASLLLVAESYKDRESQIVGNVFHENHTFSLLLKPYMRLADK